MKALGRMRRVIKGRLVARCRLMTMATMTQGRAHRIQTQTLKKMVNVTSLSGMRSSGLYIYTHIYWHLLIMFRLFSHGVELHA